MNQKLSNAGVRSESNLLRSELSALRAGKANLRIDANSIENTEGKRSFLELVREAMRAVDLSQKVFAAEAKQTESVISEALSGTRHLSGEWLYAQSDQFLIALVELIERTRGLTAISKASRRAERIGELVRLLIEGAA